MYLIYLPKSEINARKKSNIKHRIFAFSSLVCCVHIRKRFLAYINIFFSPSPLSPLSLSLFSLLSTQQPFAAKDVPQLSLRLGSKLRHSHIQEGNDVYFEGTIRASPWVTEIRWWFEGKEIHTNTSAGVIVSNQSLVLQKVKKSNRGRYTCSAVNSEGEGESNTVHLRVQFAPVCKPGQKLLYGTARREAVQIACEVESDPIDVTFRWAFNTSDDNVELLKHVTEGQMSV